MPVSITPTDALIIIDVQNDFIPGGSLAVSDGDMIIDGANRLSGKFRDNGARIVVTQDWHPAGHQSFASAHEGKNPFDPVEGLFGIGPVLWPDHCVQGTGGAAFHSDLDVNMAHLIIRKGYHPTIDSYSAFLENDQETETGLSGYLESTHTRRIFICGLALDYCVFWSAMDSAKKGFETPPDSRPPLQNY